MSELLIELFSEEIPARMQARAAADLADAVTAALAAEGLGRAGAKEPGRKDAATEGQTLKAIACATPRRLALVVDGVLAQSPTVVDERKGPRVGAPEAAIQGFLKGAGLARIEDTRIVEDKKGSYYVATVEKRGRSAAEIVAAVMPGVLSKFHWPKSMRFGATGATWVRPLHSIICLLDGKVVPFEWGCVKSGNSTRGHRFHGNDPFSVRGFEDYATKLKERKVLLLTSERALMIREQAQEIAAKAKLRLVEDEGLLAENAGLAEWPVVMMGSFDAEFLEVPAECLTTSMRTHQKCFSLEDPKTGRLANRFLLVSNLIAADGGKTIVAGNEKVIRARLSDARFFWSQDLQRPLDEMASDLAGITFHEKLGSQKDRVERIAELAHEIAGAVDADASDARRAAQLAKADLVSGMVGEFPELQGLMGRYYAEKAGTKPEIARAIELHYKPKGPTDTVPREESGDAVAIAVALADKLDTLVGFWAIGEKPTGSGDPYQLRRAALGVIRIVLENDLRLPLHSTFAKAASRLPRPVYLDDKAKGDLLIFFAERLKVHLRDKGVRHDLIDAVFALGGQDDLALIVRRVEALAELLGTEDGANLLAGAKRAANIVAIEEKKDKRNYDGAPDPALLSAPEEKALAAAIESVTNDTRKAIDVENFAGAMRALAELRAPVDAFFEKVTVNVDDRSVRENRLKLLARIRAATMTVADMSRIAG